MKRIPILASILLLATGCATTPTGPTVAVMPAPGKPFEVFQGEDCQCRQYARFQSTDATRQTNNQAVNSAAVGTAIGAVAGGMMGGNRGVGTGAGVGLILGSANGSGQSAVGGRDAQWQYNVAYEQCMYAKGNLLPGQRSSPAYYPPPRMHRIR